VERWIDLGIKDKI
jgi:hypothetical protein